MKRFFSILFIFGGFAFAFVQLAPFIRQNAEDRSGPSDRPWQNREQRGWGGPPREGNGPRLGGPRFGAPRRGSGVAGPLNGVQAPIKLIAQFDKNGDGWLNSDERKLAREFLEAEHAEGRGRRGPGIRAKNDQSSALGPKLAPAEVKNFPETGLYDLGVLRTIFLEFEDQDWEKELADFYHTDVEVPARLTLDGKIYSNVGVHFRGASSFFTVGLGRKHSLNVSIDFTNKEQDLYGYRTLNLLNSHEDPTFLRSVLYLQAARDYISAPKANFVRVVINGESWGIYVNAQQFNKEFARDFFGTTNGARWKVPGSPRARGALEYLGEHASPYKKIYEIKSKDSKKSWRALIALCRVLNEAPAEKLEQELSPILDIDGALKFLALENALINCDGYWIRTSDYSLYLDREGRFHIIPHDANETFREPEGPGWRSERPGVELDPLQGADDPSKPLLSKLLAVPALRVKYLNDVHQIATKWLDWSTIKPLAERYQAMIASDVNSDVHKLYDTDLFVKAVSAEANERGFRGAQKAKSLKDFVERRQTFLLNHPAVKQAIEK